ncbi:MAG TPA: cytochrome c biogenesis protein CcsA [Ferruginibacter sp.]|nr:cytochrome c biogenesis protein CcsA [Ferruginibacter sp.]HRO17828.1 cytochrome c biogenesis protein CcsA [Ferruginibacter sp.]HRQ19767.1 cytochrome c biogenesis protein CcsA [Ferruginibacter sp.]
MNFEGEHLLPGQLGHFFVILAFIASLVATVAWFNANRTASIPDRAQSWLKLARAAFITQVLSALIVFGIVYYICANHYFEYLYVYKHASVELEPKYLLACIWEGQEGSFLLWALCHSIIGSIFLLRKNTWEAPVMTILSLAQAFLFMMILGIYIFDVRIGNGLFVLTRNELEAPIFNQPNYLNFIRDGIGLNVLLRNYWMVIHPPFLFLGFAASIIPFGFAYAGLVTRRYKEWVKPAMPWLLFCTAVLGAGIMMGGKWAYESLSFGGYWAWDPVENASLVPWLILIAGLHTMLIFMHTGRALRASVLFAFLGFSFVLYSTFLTRTGILGDTSVHSFTEAGSAINVMIRTFMLFFTLLGLFLFFRHYKKIPAIHTEEKTNSREFWMFIGSIVIFLSAIFIIAITSIPVYNQLPGIKNLIIRLHGGPLAMPEDPEFLYNKVMAMVAIILGLFTAIAQYFRYKDTPGNVVLKKIALPTLVSALVTLAVVLVYPLTYDKQGPGFKIAIYLGFFAMFYAMIANGFYLANVQKGKLKAAGGSIAHIGFAIMIAGMLVSSSNKQVISSSLVNGITFEASKDPRTGKAEDPQENLTLIRQVPTRMERYEVTYLKDSAGHEKGRKFYQLQFTQKDKATGKINEQFMLYPDVYLMKDNNMSSNPDIRTYPTRDIFTFVSYALKDNTAEDTTAFNEVVMNIKDTAFYSNGYMILEGVLKNPNTGRFKYQPNDMALVADIRVVSKDTIQYAAQPAIEVDQDHLHHVDDTLYAQNLFLRFNGVTADQKIRLGIRESDKLIDFVTVKTIVFPYINAVWAGLVIMIMGIFTSMVNRAGFSKTKGFVALLAGALFLVFMFLFANN